MIALGSDHAVFHLKRKSKSILMKREQITLMQAATHLKDLIMQFLRKKLAIRQWQANVHLQFFAVVQVSAFQWRQIRLRVFVLAAVLIISAQSIQGFTMTQMFFVWAKELQEQALQLNSLMFSLIQNLKAEDIKPALIKLWQLKRAKSFIDMIF